MGTLQKIQVKNIEVENVSNWKYMVIREFGGEYWYYGVCDDLLRCSRMAREIGNGLVIETERVEGV